MMSFRQLTLAVMLTAAAACSPAPDDDALPDPTYCVLPTDTSTDPPPSREIALGDGLGADFQGYQSGQTVALVAGWQSGYMVTPRVRVEALPGDGDVACWQVHLTNHLAAGEAGPGMLTQLEFVRQGDGLFSDALPDLVGYELDELSGQSLSLDFSVEGIGVDEDASVTVVLQDPS